jgi:hypothetical protein
MGLSFLPRRAFDEQPRACIAPRVSRGTGRAGKLLRGGGDDGPHPGSTKSTQAAAANDDVHWDEPGAVGWILALAGWNAIGSLAANLAIMATAQVER